jgi:hypothetical protein
MQDVPQFEAPMNLTTTAPVFLASPWIPPEWVKAHRLHPRGLWFEESIPQEAPPSGAGLCALAEMAVRSAIARPQSAVIFATTCDQQRRGFDAATARAIPRAFLFNIPATQTPAAKQIYRSELARLGQFLCEVGGRAPAPELLRREMIQASQARRRLLQSAPAASPRHFAQAVARFHGQGVFSEPKRLETEARTALAIVGGPLYPSHWPLLETIENAGGRVVLNATETGELSVSAAYEVDTAADPFEALVEAWFGHIVDVFQRPNTPLYSWLKPRLVSRQVRGILLWHFSGCDLWRAEAQTLRGTFGLPVLVLEAADGLKPRNITRLRAFVETLK